MTDWEKIDLLAGLKSESYQKQTQIALSSRNK